MYKKNNSYKKLSMLKIWNKYNIITNYLQYKKKKRSWNYN